MGWWRHIVIALGLVGVPAGVFVLWRGPVTTVEIAATGPPGLNIHCDYTVDGETGRIIGPVPCTVVIRGHDILYRISKDGPNAGYGVLSYRVTTNGEGGRDQSVHTPGGSHRYHLPARHFWMRRAETPSTSAD